MPSISIYVNCAGSYNANGVYYFNLTGPSTGWFDGPNGFEIVYDTDRWILQDAVDQYYALITENATDAGAVSDGTNNNWITLGGGESPAPKSYYYSNGICGVLEVSNAVDGNGPYQLFYTNGSPPAPYYVSNIDSDYTLEIITYEQDAGIDYAIWMFGHIVNGDNENLGMLTVIDGEPPIGQFTSGSPPTVSATVGWGSGCDFLDCDSITTPSGSGFFVYKHNNEFKIQKSGNSFFIRAV